MAPSPPEWTRCRRTRAPGILPTFAVVTAPFLILAAVTAPFLICFVPTLLAASVTAA